MRRLLLGIILIAAPIILLVMTTCMRGDKFEQIPSQKINQQSFPNMGKVLKLAFEEGFDIKEDVNDVILTYKDHSYKFNYPIYLSYLDEDYLVLLTGNRTSDTGWRAMVFPTFTRIIVFKKKGLEIVFEKTIYENASKAMVDDGYVYFGYGEYPNLKYGRFPFPE